MGRLGFLLGMTAGALVLLFPVGADACTCRPAGYGLGPFMSRVSPGEVLSVPRNVGVFIATLRSADDGSEIPLEELTFEGLARPTEPLPPGTEVVATSSSPFGDFSTTAVTTGVIDTEPPTAPVVHSVRTECSGECCCSQSIEFAILAGDDETSSSRLAYAVYWGITAEDALTSTQPRDFGVTDGTSLQVSYAGWSWVAVSALDAAGNESERSNAVRVDGSSGCATMGRSRVVPSHVLWAALLALWACRRFRAVC